MSVDDKTKVLSCAETPIDAKGILNVRWKRDNKKHIDEAERLMRASCDIHHINSPIPEEIDHEHHIENLERIYFQIKEECDRTFRTFLKIFHLAYIKTHASYFYYEQMIRNIRHDMIKYRELKKMKDVNESIVLDNRYRNGDRKYEDELIDEYMNSYKIFKIKNDEDELFDEYMNSYKIIK